MFIAAAVFAGLAAALHIFIFYLESLAWEGETARKTFNTGTPEQARPFTFYAYNQGFYNLFLALQTIVGIAILLAGSTGIGAALILAGTGSMLAAALVLLLSSASHRAAALKQGTLPLLAVLATVVGLLS